VSVFRHHTPAVSKPIFMTVLAAPFDTLSRFNCLHRTSVQIQTTWYHHVISSALGAKRSCSDI